MVDKTVLAQKLAAVRDAVARIADILPATAEDFRSDRTRREVVTLNLIAHQYGTLDFDRLFVIAATQRGDLLEFCEQLARRAAEDPGP